MKLIIQPGEGIAPLVKAIDRARKSIEIIIFRFDHREVERALARAVERRVSVHALITFTNRGGEQRLRSLERRFLDYGITVARSNNDLIRYHGKMLLVDGKELWVCAFNFTHLDIEHSRSFAVVTRNAELLEAASGLFASDVARQKYTPGSRRFLVSPLNARKELAAFLRGAKKELLIYDIKVSDKEMARILEDRVKAGVQVRMIGSAGGKAEWLAARRMKGLRLHARVIIRDGRQAFVGSQSLSAQELDERREIGVIVRDRGIVAGLTRTFEEDWRETKPAQKSSKPSKKRANAIAKEIARQLPVKPVVDKAVKRVLRTVASDLEHGEVKELVDGAVKSAVQKAVKKAVEGMAS